MRVLEVCVDLDGGGIDRYLLNYCSRIKDIHFDFAIVENGKVGVLEKDILAMGSDIYRVPRQTLGIKENYKALKKIMTENKYDAVHVHLGYKSAVALLCAKNAKIKARACHAHIAYEPENTKQKILRKIFTFFTKRLATNLLGCGIDAAKWVWGKKEYEKGNVWVQHNAIDTKKFLFSEEARQSARKELGLSDDCLAVGHVGRLCEQKNQTRLVDIFKEILKERPDAHLFMVGRGHLEDAINERVKEYGLEEKVTLLGIRDDVSRLLNAFDVFVFPSTHEGLPFTLIETQCNGLYAVSADTVTDEVKLGECVKFLSLEDSDKFWASEALKLSEEGHRVSEIQNVISSGYDIDTEAEKLRKYYFDISGVK